MFVIIIENVWTRSKYVFPKIFSSEEEVVKELDVLRQQCSTTGKIKNNVYTYGVISSVS